ncbi:MULTISPECIES: hypothetical protein [unclassified Nostoc]|uniref:hypothetical protein n=1 Tax=unclassified Nostoc TaxID=2593658 RepID=UPI002AD22BC0|nr:hypothetical protein [Nostoc sp. ChiQUE02]MDZ8234090.1 hypothetical protein [Nostoc sp. ChiQUE02]
MKQAFFWGCWFTTLGTTGLLFLWSLPLSPFSHPGITANEAAIIFFPVMGLRWLAVASTLALVVIAWGQHLNLATGSVIGLTILVLALHLVFGLINIGIMNVWLSVEPIKTRATNAVYAVIYFGLPIFWILLTAALMLSVSIF